MPHTYFRQFMNRFRATPMLALLLLALLCAQWAGLQHRIAHAWVAASAAAAGVDPAASSSNDDGLSDNVHSCKLFDAAALGVTLQSAFFVPLCIRAMIADAQAPASPPVHAHPFRHFSPRGPPLR